MFLLSQNKFFFLGGGPAQLSCQFKNIPENKPYKTVPNNSSPNFYTVFGCYTFGGWEIEPITLPWKLPIVTHQLCPRTNSIPHNETFKTVPNIKLLTQLELTAAQLIALYSMLVQGAHLTDWIFKYFWWNRDFYFFLSTFISSCVGRVLIKLSNKHPYGDILYIYN